MVNFDVTGKRVVIVGASSGLGYVIAREFSLAGAVVTIVAEVPEVSAAAATLTEECGRSVSGIICDITDRDGVAALAGQLDDVDVLINNAALTVQTPVTDRSEETAGLFERTVAINFTGPYWVTQALLPKMRDGSRILFTSSLWGKTAGSPYSAYVSSKHALIGLVRTLALELGHRGISVNAVCPHSIGTEANLRATPEDVAAATATMVMRRGLIPPEDIAGVYLFLASPAASEITGQALSVDRGASLF